MLSEHLPESGAAFHRRFVAAQAAIGGMAAVLVSFYLTALVRFSPDQWKTFLWLVAGYAVLSTIVSEGWARRQHRNLRAWLDAPEHATREQVAAALTEAGRLPVRTVFYLACSFGAAGAMIGSGLEWTYPELRGEAFMRVAVSAFSGGLLANTVQYFTLKRLCAPIVEILSRLPGAELAEHTRIPLSTKLLTALSGVALSTVFFSVMLAQVRAERPLESQTAELQLRMLHSGIQPGADFHAIGEAARELGLGTLHLSADPSSDPALPLTPQERRSIERSPEAGQSTVLDSPHCFTWRRLADGRTAIAWLPLERLAAHTGRIGPVFGLLLAVVGLVSALVASLFARDVSGVAGRLRSEAERIAGGDLSGGDALASDDELGDLGRVFVTMRDNLRMMVQRVAATADGVEAAAAELVGIGRGVSDATEAQVRGVREATRRTDAVREQVSGIAGSAQGLSQTVEESSSSVLEMGAAGEQLSQTAGVLSEQMESVSSALEQMLAGVASMQAQVDGVREASIETSSSIEEMAGSMRDVDANASETARLSLQVVEVAEGGRHRVQETIAGMEAIRDATETAQAVIRGLGVRTEEIGAVVDVIDDVADETNLLALNAAIIAAQAGEHGRAFTVVADEIKELAERVMSSTKEIGALVGAVQAETAAAVTAIEEGSASVLDGVSRSAQAGESLEVITRTARESGSRIAEIVAAVQQQTGVSTHVATQMDRVRGAVESLQRATAEQGTGSAQVLSAVRTLREVSQQLDRTTREQSRGGSRIREGVERVRQAVDTIDAALQEQSAACTESAESMAEVLQNTHANEGNASRMRAAGRDLLDQAAALREGIARFRISHPPEPQSAGRDADVGELEAVVHAADGPRESK